MAFVNLHLQHEWLAQETPDTAPQQFPDTVTQVRQLKS